MEPRYFIHEHPLHFFEELSYINETEPIPCSGCSQPMSAEFYACTDCEFFLHKSCSKLPLNINHPFHHKHALTLLAKPSYEGSIAGCNFCRNYVYRFVYNCSSCDFDLDLKCALLPQFLTGDFPIVDHFTHVEHPLIFIEKVSDEVELASSCSVCLEQVLGTSFYGCFDCVFFLHKSCSELPVNINHPFHHKHALTLQAQSDKDDKAFCHFCCNDINGFAYNCSSCKFKLDIKCALLPQFLTGDFPKSNRLIHVEHPLIFIEKLSDEVELASSCSVCSKSLSGVSFYNCPNCQFFLHKVCEAEFVDKIEHFAHPEHPLIRVFSKDTCKFCQGDGKKIGYLCESCDFYIHHACTLPRFIPESKIHDHQLCPFINKTPFICNACGASGDYARFFCVTCSLMIHWDCILLPKTIKFRLHNHLLRHNYRLPQKEGEKWTCQFCYTRVEVEYGSYKCLRLDCNYVLHGSCVKKNQSLYEEIESENEGSDPSSSSCIVVLGNKIRPFRHKHELVINEEVMKSAGKKYCSGCVRPILTPSYSCPQPECNFSLHEACARIGRTSSYWTSQRPLDVAMFALFTCQFCMYHCSGICYFTRDQSRDKFYYFCHRCREIDFVTTHEGHEHSLFFANDHKAQCSGCGNEVSGAYRCTIREDCNFSLDFRCLTRPLTAQHRYHEHPLKLTYEDPNKDDDPLQLSVAFVTIEEIQNCGFIGVTSVILMLTQIVFLENFLLSSAGSSTTLL